MAKNITEKIIASHMVEGKLVPGEEIGIRINQTLTHDVTGTLAYLAFESLEIPRVKTKLSTSYVDHNLLQIDFKNMDDHIYLQTIAKKYGIYFSRAGNGICHSVQYQRLAVPGETLLGTDSHTPTSGAVGALAIGAGGLDVAMAMAGEPFYIKMPGVINVRLKGKLKPGVAPKDIILEILRMKSVKGGLGRVLEYTGEGIRYLSVPDRATITNMGAELGATTSIFPSDEVTRNFLRAQKREYVWTEILPDPEAGYEEVIEIDLDLLEPLVAKPHMPDNVEKVRNCNNVKVSQVFIGSCTNASYSDIAKATEILDGQTIHPDVSLSVSISTRQTMQELIRDGYIQKLITAGARIMECGCGACVGIGQAPNTKGVSVRTSNRNFRGRSGTLDALVYLVSPEVAAATAIKGYLADPRDIVDVERLKGIQEPRDYMIDDRLIIAPVPLSESSKVQVIKGPNIKPLPVNNELQNRLEVKVVTKLGDNITTDDIIPAGSVFSSLRSNVAEISKITFGRIDPGFVDRAKNAQSSVIVGGENYGQGSSREHAAIAPMYLGVKAILAKSIARIHKANLINFGILPLIFRNEADYEKVEVEDLLILENLIDQVRNKKVTVYNATKNSHIEAILDVSDRETMLLIAGGRFNYIKQKNKIGIG